MIITLDVTDLYRASRFTGYWCVQRVTFRRNLHWLLDPKMKVLRTLETSGTAHPTTARGISKSLLFYLSRYNLCSWEGIVKEMKKFCEILFPLFYSLFLTPCSLIHGCQLFVATFCHQLQNLTAGATASGPEDGGIMFLRNFGKPILDYTASQYRILDS